MPVWAPLSMRSWAAAAADSGNIRSITGRKAPASIHGQTVALMSAARRAFSAKSRAFIVEPVSRSRFLMMVMMFTGAMAPEDVLSSIDKRRAELARAAKDPAWQ